MQIVFYHLDENFKFKTLAATPLRADSIYLPIPRVGDSVTLDFLPRLQRNTYEVVDVEYVLHPSANATVEYSFIKVFLHAKSSSMASNKTQ